MCTPINPRIGKPSSWESRALAVGSGVWGRHGVQRLDEVGAGDLADASGDTRRSLR